MTENTFRSSSHQIRTLIDDASRLDEMVGPMAKLALADLLIARLAGQSDAAWLADLLGSSAPQRQGRVAFCIGAGSAGTPIESASQALASTELAPLVAEITAGMNYALQQSLSLHPKPEPDLKNIQAIRPVVGEISDHLAGQMLRASIDGLSRNDMLSLLNAIVLMEEGVLLAAHKNDGDPKSLRKIASEYAFIRLLGQFAFWGEASIEEIRIAMDLIGRMTRLNNAMSDALDRAAKRAATCRKDADLLEAAVLSGCPINPALVGDIGAAATQCRLFRDGAKL